MKKLNKKGFTLIELLAVIVILAIIIVVTVPTIINTIADARVNSLWNLAGSVANSYDTMAGQDLLSSNKTVSQFDLTAGGPWQCIGSLQKDIGTASNPNIIKLADMLDLSAIDLELDGSGDNPAPSGDITENTTTATCSAIRIKKNGSAEVLLIAKDGGKFAISGKKVWAVSSQDKGYQQ